MHSDTVSSPVDALSARLRSEIRARIEARGETMAAFAVRMGISRQYLHAQLAGRYVMTITTAAKYAAALGCRLEVGLRDEEEVPDCSGALEE